jgi:signal transduction histidine kinase
MTENIWG